VAWTNHVISPGIYNVSNGFTIIWLFVASLYGSLISVLLDTIAT